MKSGLSLILVCLSGIAFGQVDLSNIRVGSMPDIPVIRSDQSEQEILDGLAASSNIAWIFGVKNSDGRLDHTIKDGRIGYLSTVIRTPATESFAPMGTWSPSWGEVVQVVNDQEMILSVDGHNTIWVKGIDTNGMSDGQRFPMYEKPYLEKKGTKEYTNGFGTKRTIAKYEVTERSKHVQDLAKKLQDGKIKHTSALAVWMGKDGTKVNATFVSFKKGTVKLKKTNGEIMEVKYKDLHKDSKKLATKLRKKRS